MGKKEDKEVGTAVVAPGRSLTTKDQTFTAGETVELSRADIETFTANGTLLDPDTKPVPRGTGVSFDHKSGERVPGPRVA